MSRSGSNGYQHGGGIVLDAAENVAPARPSQRFRQRQQRVRRQPLGLQPRRKAPGYGHYGLPIVTAQKGADLVGIRPLGLERLVAAFLEQRGMIAAMVEDRDDDRQLAAGVPP